MLSELRIKLRDTEQFIKQDAGRSGNLGIRIAAWRAATAIGIECIVYIPCNKFPFAAGRVKIQHIVVEISVGAIPMTRSGGECRIIHDRVEVENLAKLRRRVGRIHSRFEAGGSGSGNMSQSL